MKEVTVFLACAAKLKKRKGDCGDERDRFKKLVEKLSKEKYEKYGIKIIPLQSKDGKSSGKGGIQDEYDQQIRNSRLCFVLIGTYVGPITEHEYNVANKAREETDLRLSVFFRTEPEASKENKEKIDTFRRKVQEEKSSIYFMDYSEDATFDQTVLENINEALQDDLKEAIKRYQAIQKKRKKAWIKLGLCALSAVILLSFEAVLVKGYLENIPLKDIHIHYDDNMEDISIDKIFDTLDETGKGIVVDAQNRPSGKDGHLNNTIKMITIAPGYGYPLDVSPLPGEISLLPGGIGTINGQADLESLMPFSSNKNAVRLKLKNILKKEFVLEVPEDWKEDDGYSSIIYFFTEDKQSDPIYVSIQSTSLADTVFSAVSKEEKWVGTS